MSPSRHPVNQAMVDNAPIGARIADAVTGFLGSWRFIILQTLIVLAWIAGNVVLLFHFDAFRDEQAGKAELRLDPRAG